MGHLGNSICEGDLVNEKPPFKMQKHNYFGCFNEWGLLEWSIGKNKKISVIFWQTSPFLNFSNLEGLTYTLQTLHKYWKRQKVVGSVQVKSVRSFETTKVSISNLILLTSHQVNSCSLDDLVSVYLLFMIYIER